MQLRAAASNTSFPIEKKKRFIMIQWCDERIPRLEIWSLKYEALGFLIWVVRQGKPVRVTIEKSNVTDKTHYTWIKYLLYCINFGETNGLFISLTSHVWPSIDDWNCWIVIVFVVKTTPNKNPPNKSAVPTSTSHPQTNHCHHKSPFIKLHNITLKKPFTINLVRC